MKKVHAIALGAAAFLCLGGMAVAQTVSDADPYQQGYAAGASAKEQNSFNAFDSGYRAGATAETQSAGTQAYNSGYEAGLAQANKAQEQAEQAYNEGYQDRGQQDQNARARAFDNGFAAGAERQARNDDEFP